jgi:hypothetical protein
LWRRSRDNKKPTAMTSRGFLLNRYVQQAPTASPATTTTRLTACVTFFNIGESLKSLPRGVKRAFAGFTPAETAADFAANNRGKPFQNNHGP